MSTTVTGRNMVSIPKAVADRYGIVPGWKLEWIPGKKDDELVVKLIPDRAELARRLRGSGKRSNGETLIDELVEERKAEDRF